MPSSYYVEWVIDWIDAMTREFGPMVYGHGRSWDWGQALCVELYGLDSATWPNAPDREAIDRAIAWQEGEDWPRWAKVAKEEVLRA